MISPGESIGEDQLHQVLDYADTQPYPQSAEELFQQMSSSYDEIERVTAGDISRAQQKLDAAKDRHRAVQEARIRRYADTLDGKSIVFENASATMIFKSCHQCLPSTIQDPETLRLSLGSRELFVESIWDDEEHPRKAWGFRFVTLVDGKPYDTFQNATRVIDLLNVADWDFLTTPQTP